MPEIRPRLCLLCGNFVYGGELCSHHVAGEGQNWAMGNRAMCDFFHRGKVAKRKPMSPEERWWYETTWGMELPVTGL